MIHMCVLLTVCTYYKNEADYGLDQFNFGLTEGTLPWLKRVHALAAVEILMFSKC